MKQYLICLGVAITLPLGTHTALAHGGSGGSPDWDAVAQCESTNTNANTGNGYYGYYQFDLDTWAETGRSGNPTDYSKAEQTQAAQELYNSPTGGGGRWPTCVGGGGRGGSQPAPAASKASPRATETPRETPSYAEDAPTAPTAKPTSTANLALTG